MKVFALAAVSLLLCLIFTVCGMTYTTSVIDRLNLILKDLPQLLPQGKSSLYDTLAGVRRGLELWREASIMTRLGMYHSDYDEVESLLMGMETAVLTEEGGAYAGYAASLRKKLTRLSDSEGFSLDGIF